MKQFIKGQWMLVRGRKYTTLLFKGEAWQKWTNEDIALSLKTDDFDAQVEFFKNYLK